MSGWYKQAQTLHEDYERCKGAILALQYAYHGTDLKQLEYEQLIEVLKPMDKAPVGMSAERFAAQVMFVLQHYDPGEME
jgi:hypothetical protein